MYFQVEYRPLVWDQVCLNVPVLCLGPRWIHALQTLGQCLVSRLNGCQTTSAVMC